VRGGPLTGAGPANAGLQLRTDGMERLTAEYDAAMGRWLDLNELVEAIERQKSQS